MREIIFRAWDKVLNKYHYFDGIFNKKPYTERSVMPQYESCPEYHKLILEQFTGLHDKNGKEIYEGDIIQSPKYYTTNQTLRALVESKKGGFKADWFVVEDMQKKCRVTTFQPLGCNFYPDNWEIIGNVHQNKDLLEGKE